VGIIKYLWEKGAAPLEKNVWLEILKVIRGRREAFNNQRRDGLLRFMISKMTLVSGEGFLQDRLGGMAAIMLCALENEMTEHFREMMKRLEAIASPETKKKVLDTVWTEVKKRNITVSKGIEREIEKMQEKDQ